VNPGGRGSRADSSASFDTTGASHVPGCGEDLPPESPGDGNPSVCHTPFRWPPSPEPATRRQPVRRIARIRPPIITDPAPFRRHVSRGTSPPRHDPGSHHGVTPEPPQSHCGVTPIDPPSRPQQHRQASRNQHADHEHHNLLYLRYLCHIKRAGDVGVSAIHCGVIAIHVIGRPITIRVHRMNQRGIWNRSN